MPDSSPYSAPPASIKRMIGSYDARIKELEEQLEAAQIENRFWRSQVGADPDEPLAIPIHGEAPPEAIELGRKLAERYGWESNPAKSPNA